MRLTTKGRYAVMAMAELAQRSDGRPVSLAEIADRQAISLSYLEQLFARLRRSGLVTATRGPGGGYRMARAAAEVDLAAIFQAVGDPEDEGPVAPFRDPAERGGDGPGRDLTQDLWLTLGQHIHGFLAGVTLADVLDNRLPPPQGGDLAVGSPAPAGAGAGLGERQRAADGRLLRNGAADALHRPTALASAAPEVGPAE